jgi:hypothetical protein
MNKVWLAITCTLALQNPLWAEDAPATSTPVPNAAAAKPTSALPLTDLRTFVDVFERIRQ